jgi:hypothetical protein
MHKANLPGALWLALLLLTPCPSLLAGDSPKAPQVDFSLQKVAFQIGETTIHAQVRQFGSNRLTMVNVHDDEQASVDAAVVVLEKCGGRLIELTHSGKRRVVFSVDGKSYSFDPNRIFSKAGVRFTVRGEGTVPDKVHVTVDKFAAQFIRFFQLGKKGAFIALHNNGNGDLSIHTYEPGGNWAADTDELHASPDADPDNFFFVTDKAIFDALRKQKYNVILQDNSIRRDDGSLSVFAGRHKIRYINVEAQPDQSEEQIRMIEAAIRTLQ